MARRRKTYRAAGKSIGRSFTPAAFVIAALAAVIIVLAFPELPDSVSRSAAGKIPAAAIEGGASVCFIDVGQGDCALIQAGDTDILIDSGEYGSYPDVCRVLNLCGVKDLEYVIVSHPHSDHMGCMSRILERYGAKEVIMPEIPDHLKPVSASYVSLMSVIGEKKIPVVYAEPGTTEDLGDAGALDIIAPVAVYDDLNNMSAVVRYRFGGVSFLFCGDIEKEAEQDILASGADVSADVIKVPHHGSGSSSTRAFVQAVSPDYAVFCCGVQNDFGHPHSNIVQLYSALGAQIYRTDINGTVMFVTDGENVEVSCENERAAAA